jgi:cellulose synthase/poly-beta-1,6-N-acetylglucosamine synthase-like glycosyltransferase
VVNNGSTDGTERFLARWSSTRPWTRVVTNRNNLGFAAGNNCGARTATGEYLIFLNNDTFVTDGWVGDLLAHFRRHPKLGLLGPITNRSGNESVIRIQYSNMEQMAVGARSYTAGHRQELTQPHVLHWFCVMTPRVVWEQVGELDEGSRTTTTLTGCARRAMRSPVPKTFSFTTITRHPSESLLRRRMTSCLRKIVRISSRNGASGRHPCSERRCRLNVPDRAEHGCGKCCRYYGRHPRTG